MTYPQASEARTRYVSKCKKLQLLGFETYPCMSHLGYLNDQKKVYLHLKCYN